VPRLRVESVYGPAKREIFKHMRAFNKRACGSDYRPLAITLRQDDEIVGGLIGETYWGWLYINSLWIAENLRRKNLGKALIEKAEAEARKRGVRNVFLDSFTFQAPKFYMKLGYREFGRLNDFPVGHDRIWLTKAL
jgi:ribosomal protein S18 acetylase RimI-like enzyme